MCRRAAGQQGMEDLPCWNHGVPTAQLRSHPGEVTTPAPGRRPAVPCTRLSGGSQESEEADQYSVPRGRHERLHPFVWKDTSN